MQTATATTSKPTTKRTRKTTGNRAGRTTATGATIDAGNLQRLQEDEDLAARAGLSLPPPVYTLGTSVNEIGRRNFETKRAAWETRPGFGTVCADAIARIRAERRANVEVKLSDLFMRSNGSLAHAPVGTSTDAPAAEWQLTKTGLMGLMGPISGANGGARYLLEAPADLRSLNLNYWISALMKDEKAREKTWSLRTRACMDPRQAGQREVFAATSTSYPVLDADTLAEVAAAAVPRGAKGELVYDGTRFRLGASWFSDIQPAQVCAGEVFRAYVFLDTRDDGLGSIRVRYGVERNLCLNLIILGRAETKLSVRHAGNAGELRAAVEAAAACRVRAEGLPRIERDEAPVAPVAAAEPVIEYDAAPAPAETEPVIEVAAEPAAEVEPASEPIAAAEAALEAAQELVNAGGAEPAQDAADGAPAPEAPAPAADATPANTGAETAAPAAPAKRARKAPEPKAERARDPRLPAVGTVMQHAVRGKVLAECVETKAGEFIDRGPNEAGAMVDLGTHKSIHKAAFAAQQRLGLRNSGANGFRFYNLNERAPAPKRAPRGKDHGAAISKAWSAYKATVDAALAAAGEDAEARAQLHAALEPNVSAHLRLAGKAAA